MLRITVVTKSGDMIQTTKQASAVYERNRTLDWFDSHNVSCYVVNVNDNQQYIIPIDNIDSISLEDWSIRLKDWSSNLEEYDE